MSTSGSGGPRDPAGTGSGSLNPANASSVIQIDNFDPAKQTWKRWLQRLQGSFKVFKITTDEEKVVYLLHYIGVEAFGVLCDRLDPVDPYAKSFGELCNNLGEFYAPEPLEIAEIYTFRKRMQKDGEAAQEYLAALQKLSLHCKFGNYLKTELQNQFVFGIKNPRIQARLLESVDLTMERALKIAYTMEMADQGVHQLKDEPLAAVDFVGAGSKNKKKSDEKERKKQKFGKAEARRTSKGPGNVKFKNDLKNNKIICFRCGGNHLAPSCSLPRSMKCLECGGYGHLKKVCKKKGQTNYIEDIAAIEACEHTKHRSRYTVSLQVENKRLEFDVDCGAAVTLVSQHWLSLNFPKLKMIKTELRLRSYCRKEFAPVGYVRVKIKDLDTWKYLNMYVVKYDRQPLLGREWMNQLRTFNKFKESLEEIQSLNFIEQSWKSRLNSLLGKYANVTSEDFSPIKKIRAQLNLKSNSQPVFLRSRQVPFQLRNKVENELNRMEKAGILKPVEASNWATPIVPVLKKDGGVRICGDFSVTVNSCLIIDEHPLPTHDELFAKMAGCKVFSKIDLKQAYLQLELKDEDKEILTLNTSKGLYQCNRLMYGVASAPAIWQRTIENSLKNIPDITVFLDDIKIASTNVEKHFEILELVLSRLAEYNVRINLEKCIFFKEQISYLGHIIGKDGIKKEQKKMEAVEKLPRPRNVSEVRAFLGLINYYGRFIENLSNILRPLNELLKKYTRFKWTSDCEYAFKQAKQAFCSNKILVSFNPTLPVVLATDASPYGVGAVLSHIYPNGTERVIQYASCTLNDTQKKYTQIDKEAYAIIFGVKKFHNFLYGKRFTLLTDNKSITQILSPGKGLPAYSAMRMQHYAVFLQGFDFDIKYRKTENHGNADGLSRLPIKDKFIANLDALDVYTIDTVNMLPAKASEIQLETSKDPNLSKIVEALEKGVSLKKFGLQDHEFALNKGILLRKDRVVIPESLRSRILKELHLGHMGIVKMKGLARNYVWWQSIDSEIEKTVRNCKECSRVQNNPKPAPVHHWEPTDEAFQRIHMDFAGPFAGHFFLVCIDAHTKWPEVYVMKNITATSTIEKCREIFARFGIPRMLVTDNGRTFISREFQDFVKTNGIIHRFTAPYHPATNGAAERFVQTLKQWLRKTNLTKDNVKTSIQKFLFHYRITPIPELKQSPAEIMFGRKLRNRLDLIFPKELELKKGLLKYDGARNFEIGDRIAAREYLNKDLKWRVGIVYKKLGKLHYLIKLENGKIWKRHVNQLRSSEQDSSESKRRSEIDIFNYTNPESGLIQINTEGERLDTSTNDKGASPSTQPSAEKETKEIVSSQVALPVEEKINSRASDQVQIERPKRNRKVPDRYGDYLSSY